MSLSEDWSASTFLRFEDERTPPSRDLLARVVPGDAEALVDLGCGPGNSTELLVKPFPAAVTIGLDFSPDMLPPRASACPTIDSSRATRRSGRPNARPTSSSPTPCSMASGP